ncbi:MAG: 2-phosphosulfolactate phosphatase [Deltaproteobacteria bacterium]|nr:2-phosphosulfolactate phosphatase [Deltaproteobacteria bacterium]
MQIDIQLLPVSPVPSLVSTKAIVVIDVLRATSVITHAVSRGILEIIPVATVEEAFEMVKHFPHNTALLGGERGSRKIEGFDLGNSPREYIAEKVKGKRLILTTTNGTKAFHSVSSGKEVMAGSFFNIAAIARRCLDLGHDLLIFPSGDEGRFSLEDTVCGGMLIDRILAEVRTPVVLRDASQSALILYQRFKENLIEAFRLSTHGRDLMERGFEEDLAYCAQVDITDIVPIFREGVIRGH